jgi:hypothetical protein
MPVTGFLISAISFLSFLLNKFVAMNPRSQTRAKQDLPAPAAALIRNKSEKMMP